MSVSAGHPATVLLYDKECEALIRERIPVQRSSEAKMSLRKKLGVGCCIHTSMVMICLLYTSRCV